MKIWILIYGFLYQEIYYSQGEQEVNPITGVQTFYQKGYVDQQAPNDWTKANAPEWDKILRGEPLNDAEQASIAAQVQLNPGLNSKPTVLFNGLFSQDDPHFQNVAKYFEDQANKKSTPEIEAKISGVLAAQKAHDDAMAAYYASTDYKDYQTKMSAYIQSADYKAYQVASHGYTQSPAYLTYQSDLAHFQAQPAYQDFLKAQSTYKATQAYQDYLKASQAYSVSPAYQHWMNQVMASGGTFNFAANPAPPAPTPPTGAPTPPTGAPTPPSYPVAPPAPVAPAAPDVKAPVLSELSADEMTVYNYRAISSSIKTQGKPGPFLPTPPA